MAASEYLVAYDICDPRRLRRVAKLMERFGARMQKSVFECVMPAASLDELLDEAAKLIDPAEDGIRVYPLPAGVRERARLLGLGPPPPPPLAAAIVV